MISILVWAVFKELQTMLQNSSICGANTIFLVSTNVLNINYIAFTTTYFLSAKSSPTGSEQIFGIRLSYRLLLLNFNDYTKILFKNLWTMKRPEKTHFAYFTEILIVFILVRLSFVAFKIIWIKLDKYFQTN